MRWPTPEQLTNIARKLFLGLLLLVPFHALLTVVAAKLTGHYIFWRLWEEIVLLLIVVLLLFARAWPKPAFGRSRLCWLVVLYVALHFLLGAVAYAQGRVNLTALAAGLIINLRLPFVFCVGLWVASVSPELLKRWRQLLIGPATVVIGFGLLQIFALPTNFLSHLGYGPATIPAVQTVDQKIEYQRIQSTLRGANPLGAYLVVVMAALAALCFAKHSAWRRYGPILVLALPVLVFSYSRSAYAGLLISVVALGWLSAGSWQARRWLIVGLIACSVVVAGLLTTFRQSDRLQNTLFHSDEHSQAATSSNQSRAEALAAGWHDVIHAPLGRGPGTAGPASAHNNRPARIAENYYLQIGQEVGWLGLALFIGIQATICYGLWRQRQNLLARSLLASFVGLVLVNMVSHAWADETLAVLWWGLSGGVLGSAIMQKARKDKHASKTSSIF